MGPFQIKLQKVTRLCQSKNIVTVNGQFPGPRIIAREGDRVIIKVVNHVQNNITIHWYASLPFIVASVIEGINHQLHYPINGLNATGMGSGS